MKVKVFTPADRAGLRDGDYLCSINGNDVFEMSHKGICEAIIKSSSKMEVVVERYKQQKILKLALVYKSALSVFFEALRKCKFVHM